MVATMNSYSLRKASEYTGVSEQTLRRYIKGNKIPYTKENGQYSVYESDLLQLFGERKPLNEYVTTMPVPQVSSAVEVLALVNQGFSSMTEKITQRYQDTVQPIINSTISTDEQAFIKVISALTEKLINNIVGLMKVPNPQVLTPEQIMNQMLSGIDDIPFDLRQKILTMIKETK